MGCVKADYVSMQCVFQQSGMNKRVFWGEKCRMDAPEWARGGSPVRLMSQSWVGCDQGHTGGVGGGGA